MARLVHHLYNQPEWKQEQNEVIQVQPNSIPYTQQPNTTIRYDKKATNHTHPDNDIGY
jgi:hypothetical protein